MRAGIEVYLNADYTATFVVISNDIDGDGSGRHAITRLDENGNAGVYPVVTVSESDLEIANEVLKTQIADLEADLATQIGRIDTLEAQVATLEPRVDSLELADVDLETRIETLEGP